MLESMPLILIIFDYILGLMMWTLIGRTAMNVFLPSDSDFFFMKAFVKMTNPILRVFKPITPSFLLEPIVPPYVAWFFFLFRFYIMPWLLGYDAMGMLSFPLESDISHGLYQIFGGLF